MTLKPFLMRFFKAWAEDLEIPEEEKEKIVINKNEKNERIDEKDGKISE